MAQPTLSDFIVTPASNTDFNSVGILGTSLVSTADDAFRTLASMIKSGVQTGYTTVATAAGTTVLTANSNSYQYATGVTTQTYTMPVTSTLELGRTFTFVNNSTGALTINSSGANLIATVLAGATVTIQCILLTGTTAASWAVMGYSYPGATVGSDIATASTLVLTNAGPFFNLTGTTTVTAVTLAAGVVKQARATSAFAFSTGASLIVNGQTAATNFTIPADALLEFVGYAAGVVRVLVTNVLADGSPTNPSLAFGTGPTTGFSYSQALSTAYGSASGTQAFHWNATSFLVDVALTAATTLAVTGNSTLTGTLTVNATGTSTIAGPLNIAGASAGQVVFPASQNASANANTLDDYEEGTWTPVLTAATVGNLSVAYTTQVGSYTKVGRNLSAPLSIVTSSFTYTTATGNAQITGVPFASQTLTGYAATGAAFYSGFTKANYNNMVARVTSNSSIPLLVVSGTGVAGAVAAITDFPTAGSVILQSSLVYETA